MINYHLKCISLRCRKIRLSGSSGIKRENFCHSFCIFLNVHYLCKPFSKGFLIRNKLYQEMKEGIHPGNYRLVVFQDMSNGTAFITRSTASSRDTIKWEDLSLIHISEPHE